MEIRWNKEIKSKLKNTCETIGDKIRLVSFRGLIKKYERGTVLRLKPGEFVQVLSEKEILATLDRTGALEGLPFTEEMGKYCERSFRVLRHVDRIMAEGTGYRSMKQTVILDGVTCDGEAHDECRKTCPILWKEAWLKRIENTAWENQSIIQTHGTGNVRGYVAPGCACQLLNLLRATSPLHAWDIRNYLWDIKSGTYGPFESFRIILTSTHSIVKGFLVGKTPMPQVKQGTTPIGILNLQPGELVEVKSREEILATLDLNKKNRGLSFTPEMKKYCGKRFRVLKRLDKMYIEQTGAMRQIANTVLLEGATCDGKEHRGCQRGCYCLYREIWLRRVE